MTPWRTIKIKILTQERSYESCIVDSQRQTLGGGVIRQFYTQLLKVIADTFFQGDTYRSPVYNCDMVASGVMKLVGTIIVHSVLQGGPGFPIFSPGVYNYLAKGKLNEVMEAITIKDCSSHMEHFITKVMENKTYI